MRKRKEYPPLIQGIHCDSCGDEMPKDTKIKATSKKGNNLEFCNARCKKVSNIEF